MSEPRTSFAEPWLRDVLSYLQKLDFFKGPGYPTDLSALTAAVQERAERSWLFPPGLLNPDDETLGWTADQLMATFDLHRVWFKDAEVDNQPEDYWYVRTLLDWARISRGCFRPQSLSEVWLSSPDASPRDLMIEVSFTHGTEAVRVRLSWQGGWFDYDLIAVVNKVIKGSGYQFASVHCSFDQCVFVCCLSDAEMRKLQQEQGWKFHEHLFCRA